jgi:hypothetical protein
MPLLACPAVLLDGDLFLTAGQASSGTRTSFAEQLEMLKSENKL